MRRRVQIPVAVLVGLLACLGTCVVPIGSPTSVSASPAAHHSLPWAKRTWGYLKTPSGVQLRYSVLLPKAHGRFPVLMQYDGYDGGEIGGSAYQQGDTWMSAAMDASLLRHGFAIMGLQMPGTGCSSGRFNLFSKAWGTDGALGVKWAARQRWSTGHVGMYDWSWPGLAQIFTATDRPKALDAIAPGMVVTDPLRDVGAPGGVPNIEFFGLWWATIQDSWTYAAQDATSDGDSRCAANLAHNLTADQATSPPAEAVHMYEDRFWRDRDLRARTHLIDVPVLSMVDWQDEEVGSRGGYYQQSLAPNRTWYVGTNGQHDIYLNRHFRRTLFSFMQHFVGKQHNGFAATPHVQLWQETTSAGGAQSSDRQLTHAKPGFIITRKRFPARVHATKLWLHADGQLIAHRPTPSSVASRTFAPVVGPIINNDVPGAVTGGAGGPEGEVTWAKSKPAQGGELAFSTPRLTKSITLSGPASLNLWLSSTSVNTDLQATVIEVRPSGQEEYVQRGWLRVSARAIDKRLSSRLLPVHKQTLDSTRLLTPDKLVRARLEIPAFTHTFRKGTVLRIWLNAPSGTGDWNFAQLNAGAIDTIATNRAHPSALVVGRLSGHQAIGREPACHSLVGEPCRPNPIAVRHEPSALPSGW